MINFNYIKYFAKTVALLFIVMLGFSNQKLNAQCLPIDTVCVGDLDTLCIGSDPTYTSIAWYTNNGATLNVQPGDTLLIVDWSSSSIIDGVDEVFIDITSSCGRDTFSLQTYLEQCIPPCAPKIFHQAIKRSGSPTLCDIILADPTHYLAELDCDGGGIPNLQECQNGFNPEDPIDDSVPATCNDAPSYYLGFDNHAFEPQQTAGNPISGTFPIGMVAFEDCMMPQPTPAVLTVNNQPFCIGGIKEANVLTSSNWTVANLGGCGLTGLTQFNSDNATLCEVIIDKGLASQQAFTTSVTIPPGAGSLTAGLIKDALNASNVLPACMVATGGSVAGISTNEAACVDFVGSNWQYTVSCTCSLPDGSYPTSITLKVCQDSGDYANYLLKIL